MRNFFVLVALLCSSPVLAVAQMPSANSHIVPGSTIFIEPMSGFENDLAAAIIKKHVPLTITEDEKKASYVISGSNQEIKAGWAKTIFVTPAPTEHASIQVKDPSNGQVVYAYAWDKIDAYRGRQSSAEGIAKHLKEFIEKK